MQKIRFGFLLSALAMLTVSACASKPKDCPSPEEQQVSTCRAQEKCRKKNMHYAIGLTPTPGPGVETGPAQSQGQDNFADCVERDLKEQNTINQVIEPKKEK